jgi:hypothetical protein
MEKCQAQMPERRILHQIHTDHCLLADDGKEMLTDTSMVFAMIGMCERLWGT